MNANADPKDPQAELREAIVIKLNSMFGQNYVETDEGTLFTTEIADDLVALFQAHQQQLLTELLGELPMPRDIKELKKETDLLGWDDDNTRHFGYNECLTRVVSVIQSKIGELNG